MKLYWKLTLSSITLYSVPAEFCNTSVMNYKRQYKTQVHHNLVCDFKSVIVVDTVYGRLEHESIQGRN
jgi:hypothetical protein